MANAWAVLVMIGKTYVPGALVTAQSLRQMKTQNAIVCMVTPDVDEEARQQLALVFDQVVEVPYIMQATAGFKHERQRELYGGWIDRSFTKWNCLSLIQYAKVILLDADMLFITNCDDLFELEAPAACFSNPWALDPKSHVINIYGPLVHGSQVTGTAIHAALYVTSFVGWGTMLMLEPSTARYAAYIELLRAEPVFGTELRCLSGYDESSIAMLFLDCNWTHIHQRYLAIPWKRNWVSRDIRAFHYHGRKPWDMVPDEWPDLADWWKVADRCISAHPELRTLYYATSITSLDVCLSQYRLTKDVCDKYSPRDLYYWFQKTLIASAAAAPRSAIAAPSACWAPIWGVALNALPPKLSSGAKVMICKRLAYIPRASGCICEVRGDELSYSSQFTIKVPPRILAAAPPPAIAEMMLAYAAICWDHRPIISREYIDPLNVQNEAFISPMDWQAKPDTRYYSLFPELDAPFGSSGNFFDITPATLPPGDWCVYAMAQTDLILEKCIEICGMPGTRKIHIFMSRDTVDKALLASIKCEGPGDILKFVMLSDP